LHDADASTRQAAARFGAGDSSIVEMWTAFHANLEALCAERPLEGDFLNLFEAMELWETAVGERRNDAERDACVIAERLGRSA
jgi:hypothetical protein